MGRSLIYLLAIAATFTSCQDGIYRFGTTSSEVQRTYKLCPNCGKEILMTAKLCDNCRHKDFEDKHINNAMEVTSHD